MKGTNGCLYNCGETCTGECMENAQNSKMGKDEAKDALIELLFSQVVDLTMMSKIELGNDVIAEIRRLKAIINE